MNFIKRNNPVPNNLHALTILYFFLCSSFIFMGCNQSDTSTITSDTTHITKDSILPQQKMDSLSSQTKAPDVRSIATTLLTALKGHDFKTVALYIHPQYGLRFSPYGHIDTATKALSSSQLLQLAASSKKVNWGRFDGTGEPILLTISDYFDRFVYDSPFLKAEKVSVNKSATAGNSMNNLHLIYPSAEFVEYYFSGFKKQYEGMDWKALTLVFITEKNKQYLVAVVHDQWTV